MTDWKWNGARWWKFDFHAHTPASDDYGKGANQDALKSSTPKKWLLDYMRAGIDCVAITDHNSGAWIDQLKGALADLEKEKPEGFRELYLFPGMEVSVHGGIHVLAIFDSSKTTSDIDALRGAVKYDGTPGQSDGVTRESFVDVVSAIISVGGIAIPAHVDKDNGLFRHQGITLQQVLECHEVIAMELMSFDFQKPQTYIDKKLSWTEVLGSDAHHPSSNGGRLYPGSHFTWVKMDLPSLEGLRLALLDGPLSVRRPDREPGDPNEHAPLVIEAVEVYKAHYMGRSKPFTIGLNPWLNAVIGGRGTGKSSLVEFLRLALRRKDELPDELKPEFEKYGQVYQNREDAGLLARNTEIKVVYQKNGMRFRVQWNPDGTLDPIQQETNGSWKRSEGDIQHRFPVRIYSQKQIFQLAKTPLALLRVVDEAPEVDYRSWNERCEEEKTRFLSLSAKAREIEAGLSEEPRLRGELDDVKRKLAIFEQAGHADVLKAFQKRRRQQQAVDEWEKGWKDAGDRLRQVAADIVPDLLEETPFDPPSPEDTQLCKHALETHGNLEIIRKKIEELALQTDQVLTDWRKRRDESSWKQSVDDAVCSYQDLQLKLSKEGAGDPAVYGEFVQRRQTIEQRIKELGERNRQVDEFRKQAEVSLRRLLEIRRQLTAFRRTFLENVLKDARYVRIEVLPYGNRQGVEAELRNLLQREDGGFEKDIGTTDGGGLLGELYKNGNNPQTIEDNLSNIKRKLRQIALSQHDPQSLADKRFATHLGKLPPEVLDRIDLWFPEDSLDVQYSTTGDGQRFRSIQEGSPGQKTAALLAFLLSYGEEPLILDQPEDDLDNRLIYDLIVTQLRQVKPGRQVIVVTHNANIVVNGDAELVVALAVAVPSGETRKECEGSLQHKQVRETICAVMEGGREAFEQRYRRIVLEGRHV